MKAWIKYFLVILIRNLLKVLYVLPMKNNRIVEYAYDGRQYSCSPKYLTQYLMKHYPGKFNFVWAFNEPEKFSDLEKLGIRLVKFKSLKFLVLSITSGIFIGNGFVPSYIPFRKKQFVLSTWHGGGAYKKTGLDIVDNFPVRKLTKIQVNSLSKMITSCEKFKNIFSRAYLVPDDKFICCGLPRNDIFFTSDKVEIETKVRKYFGIPWDNKILLYAPTFRSTMGNLEGNFKKGNYNIDFKRLKRALSLRFGGEWSILYRAHYFLENDIDSREVINASDYPDMQELLYTTDILITDYSSCMWDFSLTFRPCFIYASDLTQYEHDRDFYTPISKWPFPVSTNNDELCYNIKNFDLSHYRVNVQRHHEELGSFEHGNGCKTICDLLCQLY